MKMLSTFPFLFAFATAACAAEAPRTFRSESPASPAAAPAKRPSVGAVLAAKDPLEARVCAEGAPCVLPDAPAAKAEPAQNGGHGGHHHHHHGP
ncbi:hypothetical protein [Polyangium sp. 6x1]|uniref:hypothetical protein n=1 Tax=Polyangium sp. 6x1 TaxID=3042689 RepID=UPI002483272D|nr:hypothetical protein [Polyangium sp. 6x1]MDI1446397.1 hypothetical protein [Polyangium sp. 6x1]